MRLVMVLVVLAHLAACGAVSTKQELAEIDYGVNAGLVRQIERWHLTGRIGLVQSGRSWQSNIKWQHRPAEDRWVISSLLLGTLAEVVYRNRQFYLFESGRFRVLATKQEIVAELGFYPPMAGLKYWVRGLADESSVAKFTYDEEGFPQTLQQQGWLVILGRYKQIGKVWLPTRIVIQKEGLKVKMVVDKWV